MKLLRRLAIVAALAIVASAGAAAGAELLAGDPAALPWSSAPGLLGPITESGRTGWDCVPEHAARARTAAGAALPQD
ncbi:hypothetical protein WPS_30260 [Vulcanimicrobium alpinum]|uniref:Uncharacterized protein n=1 Tax=Vulcanimicrobium alpinum TaxID=3016050 RepID=A0AAN1XZG0_UNVUL|nr:hypothetical protein [Vulcanimicrobium alpinum]BDE07750.1 hypothetical protein WPS_30260 [Vulcanimicrobium alpinum]